MLILLYIFALLGSFLAGVINTFAGNGSSITLYLLMDGFGLPPNMANATNRLGIFAQGLASMPAFRQSGRLAQLRGSYWIMACVIGGAVLGFLAAMQVSNAVFKQVFNYLMLLTLVIVLIKPERWIRPQTAHVSPRRWLWSPLFLVLGFYGGFIQLGMGLFFLMATVLGLRYDLVQSNVLKVLITTIYTGIGILLFMTQGSIHWPLALLFAFGQSLGGWTASRFLTRHPQAATWAYRILVAVILVAVIRLFLF